jgi:alpha-mannosidase
MKMFNPVPVPRWKQIVRFAFVLIGLFQFALTSGELTAAQANKTQQAPTVSTNKPALWLIPHTHWEGAVFKTREEYLETGLPIILTVLRLLKEEPNYRFTLDQVAFFKPFLERYPEEAATFRKFVSEGRLQIVGGFDVMPDVNMPSGESFVRSMLYAKGYCREALGADVKVGWLLDTFGHHAQMPQLLKLGGYDSFWFWRGAENRDAKDRPKTPSEFLWQGIDGTRIPTFFLPYAYVFFYGSPTNLPAFTSFMQQRFEKLTPFSPPGADLVGLPGMDVAEPELHLPALVEQFNRQPNMPFALRFGVPTDYEAVVAKRTNHPVVTGERNPVFQGVYSSRIELKQWMRNQERLLTTAEKLGALANWLGTPSDDATLWRAWEPTLFNVTHDLASGVMTDRVYEDTIRSYEFSKHLADELIETHLGSILARIDTRGEGIPLVVFNTLGWPRTDVAHGDVGFAQSGVKDFELSNPAGQIIPAQLLEVERYADNGLKRVKFAFVARDIPALGHSVFRVVPRHSAGGLKASVTDTNGGNMLENGFYRAGFDLGTGALTNLFVKAGGWQALKAPGNVVARETDKGDFWELNRNLGEGSIIMTRPLPVPQPGQAIFSTDERGSNGAVRHGPVFSEFQVKHPLGSNSLSTTARLYQGIPRVEFTTRILNNEQHVRYRLLVPTIITNGRNFQEIPFGAIERPNAQEFPAQNWIDYSDGRRGVALLNRGLPGNNVADGTLMLSLMRATHINHYAIIGGYEAQSSDSGFALGQERVFHYALVPHAGDWRDSQVARAGMEFNHPLIVQKAAPHSGTLPKQWGLMEILPLNVMLSAVKPGKDGSTIVRVYESDGLAVSDARIKFNTRILSAHETNLMEDAGGRMKVANSTLRFDLRPFEIKTFKLRLKTLRAGK